MEIIHFLARHWMLTGALVVVFCLLMAEELKMQKRNISVADLVAALNTKQLKIIDVRKAEDFLGGHIASAVNIPCSTAKAELQAADVSGKIVIIGKNPNEEQAVARLAEKLGCSEYNFLYGGMGAWEKANMPLERGASKRKKK